MLLGKDTQKTRYVHPDHMIRAHYNLADNVSEPQIMLPESSSQTISDDNANPLDSFPEPHVDLPENEDTVVSPLVVRSPTTVLGRYQSIRKPVAKLKGEGHSKKRIFFCHHQ